MSTQNNITLTVTLGTDPEKKYLGGKPLYEASAAFNGPKDRDGKNGTAWFKLKYWGMELKDGGVDYTAEEFMACRKGESIVVNGELRPEVPWTGTNGEKRESISITVRRISPGYWKREAQAPTQAPRQQPDNYSDFGAPAKRQPSPPPPMPEFGTGADDDIPF